MTQASSAAPTPRAMHCSEAKLLLGVYVLGAIDPAERALVDAHLATCRDCRDELAGLAGLPALLARVSTEEAIALAATEAPEPPHELLTTVLEVTATRRRRRLREAAFGLAAALIIAAGVCGGLRVGSSPAQSTNQGSAYAAGPSGPWETMSGQLGTMTATVSYRAVGWGTELNAKVRGIPVGTYCQLWLIDSVGHRVLAGSWKTDNNEGTVWYPASAALPEQNVAAFQITVGSGQAISGGV